MRKEQYQIPQVEFVFRENGEFVKRTSSELFNEKRVVIFSLPGAFTPTCNAYQLPGFEEKYDDFIGSGIDAIYCVSVNDGFVMNAWAQDQNIKNVKLIPDGNAYFTRSMGMLVTKSNLVSAAALGVMLWSWITESSKNYSLRTVNVTTQTPTLTKRPLQKTFLSM